MNTRKRYFTLQLKNTFKLLPKIFIITFAIFLCIALTAGFLIYQKSSENAKHKISIGIVGSLENTYLDIGVIALQNYDDSMFYMEFLDYDEEEDATKDLLSKKISGYLLIPDNYVENIYHGDNIPAKYITLNSPDGFGSVISNEVATTVSQIVTESQSGIYSMKSLARKHGIKTSEHTQRLMLSYVDVILNRNASYEVSYLGIADELSFAGYYISGFIVLFLLLWAISFNSFFAQRKLSFCRILETRQISASKQIMCEYLSYLLVTLVTLSIFAVIFGLAIQFVELNIAELVGVSVFDCILFIIACIPGVAVIAMFQYLIYEMIPDKIGALLAQFIIAIGLGYVSGCFYPSSYFPEGLQKTASLLPVGIGFSYIRKIMAGTLPVKDFLLSATYFVAFFAISSSIRHSRIKGVQND